MKPAKNATNDAIYAAAITWNVPALNKTGRDDAKFFKDVIQLFPTAFGETGAAAPKRMTLLRRAAEGLIAELTGDTEAARRHYEVVARRPGLGGVLGSLLIAWMASATEEDFDRVERKLTRVDGPGMRDVIARSHCKLAMWSFDQGWSKRSQHHYQEAKRYAGKELSIILQGIGHWFGGDRVFFMNRTLGDMTTFPWIDDWVDRAARRSIETGFVESFKSPWSRTWSFGSPSVEGIDIQSAEMQASWAGAMWKLPEIQRQHAALILANSEAPDDVARAIALWAKGGGKDNNQLVSAKEADLTGDAIGDLLINQLHEGRSVRDREVWLDICHSLWAELPDRLVDEFVVNYPGPNTDIRRHFGASAKELGLFGKLLVRSPLAVERAYHFDDWQAGLLARAIHSELVDDLPPEMPARLLEAGLSAEVLADEDWAGTGWTSLLTCWALVGEEAQRSLRRPLLDALPDGAVPQAVMIAPDLLPQARISASMKTNYTALQDELRNSAKGIWTGWASHPATDIARLATAQGSVSDEVVTLLVQVAVAETTNSQQRRSCLRALEDLARAGLIRRSQVQQTFAPVKVRSVMTDNAATDQRLEDIARLALMVQFEYDEASDGPLLAASRDSDTQVRHDAVSTVCELSIRGEASPSFDATLLGALYDPHPRVQARAIPALWRGTFLSSALLEVARARVLDMWPTAHRELRATIAYETALAENPVDRYIKVLRDLAERDRSWVVRTATRPPKVRPSHRH